MPRQKRKPVLEQPDDRKSKASASGMPRLMRCVGSPNQIAKAPPQPPTEDSQSGDRVHAYLAGIYAFEDLSDAEKKTAEICMDIEGRLVEKYSFECAEQVREQRLWHPSGLVSGKPDVVYLQDDRALCLNYKSGHLTVDDIRHNEQMMCEALLVMRHYDLFEVVACLIHPHDPQADKQEYTFSKEQLERFETRMLMAIEASEEPDAPLVPSDVACKHCPAKTICLAAVSEAVVVASVFGIPVATLTPDQRGDLAARLERASKVIKRYQEELKAIAKSDENAITGWQLSFTGATMKITDESAVRDILSGILMLPDRAYKFSLTEAVDELAEQERISKDEAKKRIKSAISKYVKYEPKEKKLERIREQKEIE